MILSSAIALNLGKAKILSSGNGLSEIICYCRTRSQKVSYLWRTYRSVFVQRSQTNHIVLSYTDQGATSLRRVKLIKMERLLRVCPNYYYGDASYLSIYFSVYVCQGLKIVCKGSCRHFLFIFFFFQMYTVVKCICEQWIVCDITGRCLTKLLDSLFNAENQHFLLFPQSFYHVKDRNRQINFYIPAKRMESACLFVSLSMCPSVCLSVYKMIVSITELAGVLLVSGI